MKTRWKIGILILTAMFSLAGFSQPAGKALEIFSLINEARVNPKGFLLKYDKKIRECEPKLVFILEKSPPIGKLIWDEDLAENCREKVNGNLNPVYQGPHELCGFSSGSGSGCYENSALYFVFDSYTHIMNDEDQYFGFYIDSTGHAFSWGKTCHAKKYIYEFTGSMDSSGVDFAKINTAQHEKGMSLMDKEMIKEINFVRLYPAVYASVVEKYLANESVAWGLSKAEYDAGVELIGELKMRNSVQILYPKQCVYQAAKKHGIDCKTRGFVDHTGSDGSSPFTRISTYCSGLQGNENIVGCPENARALVIQLLIDAGISDRGHRYNMLNPGWTYVGCYGYDGGSMYYYVQNFARD